MFIHLLDAGFKTGEGGILGYLLLIPLGIMLVEALTMFFMKFNSFFGKCFLDSFLVNLVTIIVGILIESGYRNIDTGRGNVTGIIIAFLVSVGVEGLFLQLLNRSKPPKTVWLVTFVMNLVSYAGLILVTILATS